MMGQNADEIDSMFGFGVDDVAGLLESDVRASERPPPTLPTPLSSVPGAARLPIPPNPLSVHANSFFVASTVIGHLWHMHKQLSAVPMGAIAQENTANLDWALPVPSGGGRAGR